MINSRRFVLALMSSELKGFRVSQKGRTANVITLKKKKISLILFSLKSSEIVFLYKSVKMLLLFSVRRYQRTDKDKWQKMFFIIIFFFL
jgi:hypothetical protein